MATLHVLGGGPWQVPTVRAAKAMGHRVLVTDMYADRPAYPLADAHAVVDLRDVPGTLAAARRHRVDGILCDSTDTGVATAAAVADALGLPGIGIEAAHRCTDKGALRECFAAAGIDGVAWRRVDDAAGLPAAAAAVGWPLVVKPVDSQSGRGVRRIAEASALADAYANALAHSRSQRVLVEAQASGTEFIVDSFSVDGRSSVLGIAKKEPAADNPTISDRIVYLSGSEFDAMAAVLGPVHGRVLDAIGLRQGICHAEYFVAGARVTPIDIAARGGGVMIYTHALPWVSGVDAVAASIRLALGEPVSVQPTSPRRGASIDFLRLPAGRFEALDGVAEARALPGVLAVHVGVQPGDTIGALADKDDRPGFVVAGGQTRSDAVALGVRAKALLSARMAHHRDPVAVN
jgi:biotin carboxylase